MNLNGPNHIFATKNIAVDAVKHTAANPFRIDASAAILFVENKTEDIAYMVLPRPIRGCRLLVINSWNNDYLNTSTEWAPFFHALVVNYKDQDHPGTLISVTYSCEFISDGFSWRTTDGLLVDGSEGYDTDYAGTKLYSEE